MTTATTATPADNGVNVEALLGAFLTTYVSGDAFKAITSKKGALPSGAILVKENYSPEKKLAAVTVMYRKAGYTPDAGDWFWVKYAPCGQIEKEGKVAGCNSVSGRCRVTTGSLPAR